MALKYSLLLVIVKTLLDLFSFSYGSKSRRRKTEKKKLKKMMKKNYEEMRFGKQFKVGLLT